MGESELNEAQDLNKIAIKNGFELEFSRIFFFRDEWRNDRAIVPVITLHNRAIKLRYSAFY